jgi:dynein heavy chain 1
MEVTSPASPSANGLATTAFPTIDPNLVVEYLASVIESTLGASRRELENVGSLLSKSRYSETVQRCSRFATESQAALYVQKDIAAGDGMDGVIDTSSIHWSFIILTLANIWTQIR